MVDVAYDLPIGWLPVPFLHGSDRTLPIMKPKLGSLQRVYFTFGEPIRTDQYGGDSDNLDVCHAVRDATRKAIDNGLEELRVFRSNDRHRYATSYVEDGAKILAKWIQGRRHKQTSVDDDSNVEEENFLPSNL